LACRLFPLGRQIQKEEAQYIYEGKSFPCLDGCPEVLNLPYLSVEEYLKDQKTEPFEKAQDEYLEVMQNIADIAFTLLLDTGLAESEEMKTLAAWRELGQKESTELVERIGQEWIDLLMLPNILEDLGYPCSFAQTHNEQLQMIAQEKFGSLNTNQEFHEASVLMMALALYLARALGADPKSLSEYWIEIAKDNGARG
jgi:cellobiose-specific phosphotransferase system component IIA